MKRLLGPISRLRHRRLERKMASPIYDNRELSLRADSNRRYWFAVLIALLISSSFNGAGTWYTHKSGRENDNVLKAQNVRQDKLVAELSRQSEELQNQNARLQELVDAIAAARAGNIVDACAYRQRARDVAINTAGNQARRFADKVQPPNTRTPAQQADVDSFVLEQRQAAADANPLADCSQEGIRQYYENAPPIVPCPAGGDGKGFCK